MKLKKIVISIFALIMLSINSTCFAKYTYSYTKTAVIIEINRTSENDSNVSK